MRLAFLLLFLNLQVSAQDVPPWRAVGFYDHAPIRESSGLVVSRQHEGVYWTLNDSGNPDVIYATGLDGKLIKEFRVIGGKNRDWEGMGIDDKGQLWIGGIGNNSRQRDDLRLYVLPEPDPFGPYSTVTVTATYPYAYPNANVDAEGLFIHDGLPHIISKEYERAVLYRYTKLTPDEPHVLERVGELAGGAYRITGASLSDDATMLAAVTYDRLWIYHSSRPISLVNLVRSKPWTLPHDFGVEACAFKGDELILTNERRSIFLLPKFWYSRGDALPPHRAISAVDLYPDQTHEDAGNVSLESYRDAGLPIRGHHLLLASTTEGGAVSQTIDVERDDLWEISAILTRGPQYGRVELLVDGEVVGRPYDCGASEVTAGTVATFGKAHIMAGERQLTFRLKGESQGSRIGVDGYLVQPVSPFVGRFMIVGPFDRDDEKGIDEPLKPELELNLRDSYVGRNGKEIYWQPADAAGNGRLDFIKAFGELAITQAYALTSVYSETSRDAVLLLGADDQVAVRVNGKEVHRNNRAGGAYPDEEKIPCRLEAGWNQVLCKVGQVTGGWAMYLRFNDPDGSLKYAVRRR